MVGTIRRRREPLKQPYRWSLSLIVCVYVGLVGVNNDSNNNSNNNNTNNIETINNSGLFIGAVQCATEPNENFATSNSPRTSSLRLIDQTNYLSSQNENGQQQATSQLTAQQKARVVYDFALNGEDYCQLQRFWDEQDRIGNISHLGYPGRPKKMDIYRYKDQLFKVGIKVPEDELIIVSKDENLNQITTTSNSTKPPNNFGSFNNNSFIATITNTSRDQNQNQLSNGQNDIRNKTSKIEFVPEESKLTEDDEDSLLRTVISSKNLPLDDDIRRDNKTRKDSFESDIKRLGQRRLGLLYKRLSENISLKDHQAVGLDYDEIINGTTKNLDDDKDKLSNNDQGKSSLPHVKNITIKLFNVFHYESKEQIHYIYWLLNTNPNRFIPFEEASQLIKENLSPKEIEKIMSDLKIIKLIEPYKDKKVENYSDPVTKDGSGPMSFFQSYLPKAQTFHSWEFYTISFIVLLLFLMLFLALIILCCKSNNSNQRSQETKNTEPSKLSGRTKLGDPESSTYLSFSQEGTGKDNANKFSGEGLTTSKSVWKKVSQYNDSVNEGNESSLVFDREIDFGRSIQKDRPAQFEWYSFEGKRIENTDRLYQRSSLKEQTGTTTTIASDTSRHKKILARNNQDDGLNPTKPISGTKQIIWAQDLMNNKPHDDTSYPDRTGDGGMNTCRSSDQPEPRVSRTSELVMVKEKLVPIVKVPSQSRKKTSTDDSNHHHIHKRKAPVIPHEYVNTQNQSSEVLSEKRFPSRRRSTNYSIRSKEELDVTDTSLANDLVDTCNENLIVQPQQTDHQFRSDRGEEIHKQPQNLRNIGPSEDDPSKKQTQSLGSVQVIQDRHSKTHHASYKDEDNDDEARRPTIIHIELSGRTQSMVDQIKDELTKIETRDYSRNISQTGTSIIELPQQQPDIPTNEDLSSRREVTRQQTFDRSELPVSRTHQLDDHHPSTSEA